MGIITATVLVLLILYLSFQLKNLFVILLFVLPICFGVLIWLGILFQEPKLFFLFWLGVGFISVLIRIALEPYRRKQLALKQARDDRGHQIWLEAEAKR